MRYNAFWQLQIGQKVDAKIDFFPLFSLLLPHFEHCNLPFIDLRSIASLKSILKSIGILRSMQLVMIFSSGYLFRGKSGRKFSGLVDFQNFRVSVSSNLLGKKILALSGIFYTRPTSITYSFHRPCVHCLVSQAKATIAVFCPTFVLDTDKVSASLYFQCQSPFRAVVSPSVAKIKPVNMHSCMGQI